MFGSLQNKPCQWGIYSGMGRVLKKSLRKQGEFASYQMMEKKPANFSTKTKNLAEKKPAINSKPKRGKLKLLSNLKYANTASKKPFLKIVPVQLSKMFRKIYSKTIKRWLLI